MKGSCVTHSSIKEELSCSDRESLIASFKSIRLVAEIPTPELFEHHLKPHLIDKRNAHGKTISDESINNSAYDSMTNKRPLN